MSGCASVPAPDSVCISDANSASANASICAGTAGPCVCARVCFSVSVCESACLLSASIFSFLARCCCSRNRFFNENDAGSARFAVSGGCSATTATTAAGVDTDTATESDVCADTELVFDNEDREPDADRAGIDGIDVDVVVDVGVGVAVVVDIEEIEGAIDPDTEADELSVCVSGADCVCDCVDGVDVANMTLVGDAGEGACEGVCDCARDCGLERGRACVCECPFALVPVCGGCGVLVCVCVCAVSGASN